MSDGAPHRPAGIRAKMDAERSGSSRNALVLFVSIYPGAMALTQIPCFAHSQASARVTPATPCLDAVYAATRTPP